MAVYGRKYRFRIVNGTNASVYRFALSSGHALIQIATDGGLLAAPIENESIPLAMSERADIVIDFSAYPVGSRIVLKNLNAEGRRADVMCFDVVGVERDDSELPNTLSSVQRFSVRDVSTTREFVFSGGPGSFPPTAHWRINGRDFDPTRPIVSARFGDVEMWHIRNQRRFGVLGMVHPVHIHLVRFQILERSGRVPGAHEAGWKDTVAVAPSEDVRIIARFEGHRGRYLIHCHNLEHEDHHMMARYDVV
jgi:FtsP/CotA-like multicopper oxidase with cupredoxin domain